MQALRAYYEAGKPELSSVERECPELGLRSIAERDRINSK